MVEIVILVGCFFSVRIDLELHEIVVVINYKLNPFCLEFAGYEGLTGSFCKCKREPKTTLGNMANFENTTCGESAFRRGSGQKVIGFSFYEHDDTRLKERKQNKSWINPPYFRGVKEI